MPLFCVLTAVLALPSESQAATPVGWIGISTSLVLDYNDTRQVSVWDLVETYDLDGQKAWTLTLEINYPITISETFNFTGSSSSFGTGYVVSNIQQGLMANFNCAAILEQGMTLQDFGFYGFDSAGGQGQSYVGVGGGNLTAYSQSILWRGSFAGFCNGYIRYSLNLKFKAVFTGRSKIESYNIPGYLPLIQLSLNGNFEGAAYSCPTPVWNQLESIIDLETARNSQFASMLSLFQSFSTTQHNDMALLNEQTRVMMERLAAFYTNNHLDLQNIAIQDKEFYMYMNSGSDSQIVNSDSGLQNVVADRDKQEADLLGQASDDIGSLDSLNGLDVLSDYSQSTNFWMSCVSTISTDLPQLWGILIFGFIVAFSGWVLRMRN